MPKLTKLQVFGVKTETTQGTAIALTTTDYLLVNKAEINPVPEFIERPFKRASLDGLANVLGKLYVEVDLEIEVKNGGTRGTVYPPMSALLQSAALVETVNAGTSVVYAPTSAPFSASYFGPGKSVTISVYENGIYHSVKGCIATSCKFVMKAGKFWLLQMKLRGLYVAPTDAAFPSVTYVETVKPPVWASGTFTIDGFSAVLSGCDIDFGLEAALREDPTTPYGVKGFLITGRDPKGTMDPELDSVANYDIFGKMVSRNEGALSVSTGATSGNIITIACPKVQYGDVKYGDRGGVRIVQVPLNFNQSSGDDWISVSLT